MFQLLAILLVLAGPLLSGRRHARRAVRRGILLGVLLGFFAERERNADRAEQDAREAAREERKAAWEAERARRKEILELRKAEHRQKVEEHLSRVHAEIEARKAERERRRTEAAKACRTEPVSGKHETEEILELETELERNARAAAMLAEVSTLDFPEEDEKYHSARKYGYA